MALDIALILETTYMETTPLADRGPLPGGPANDAGPGASLQEQHVIAKVSRHLLWFLFILFFFSFLDRINIGFAGLTMMKDLGLSGVQFGLATTLFYVAYIAFGIPSNIVLARIGARKWIGTIMIAWGLASTATMFASSPGTLYLLRILVGVTEAGFLPGILLYMTYWFPSAYRARANAMFMIAMPVTAADRLRALGIHPGTGWDARAQRVAMAVFSGRIAFGDPGSGRIRLSARRP